MKALESEVTGGIRIRRRQSDERDVAAHRVFQKAHAETERPLVRRVRRLISRDDVWAAVRVLAEHLLQHEAIEDVPAVLAGALSGVRVS